MSVNRIYLIGAVISLLALVGWWWLHQPGRANPNSATLLKSPGPIESVSFSIEALRKKHYPGSQMVIEQTLGNGGNYDQFIVSYRSEGLKIYGLLTVPQGQPPPSGWPVIIFNHGYIPPEQYRTTERYVAYVDALARNGLVVFKSDYRGHGQSEGRPEGAYYSPAYITDVLNGFYSLRNYDLVVPGNQNVAIDRNNMGMWGHSMGGYLTIRAMVVDKNIKAGVIWGGVVGSYQDMIEGWFRRSSFTPSQRELATRHSLRRSLVEKYGSPSANSPFWNSISALYYAKDVSGPVQLHHGLADEEVPWQFSEHLYNSLKAAGKTVEYYSYPGADHNISSPNFELAMQRSIDFFNRYLNASN